MKMAIEMVDFPLKMGMFNSHVNVYRMVSQKSRTQMVSLKSCLLDVYSPICHIAKLIGFDPGTTLRLLDILHGHCPI